MKINYQKKVVSLVMILLFSGVLITGSSNISHAEEEIPKAPVEDYLLGAGDLIQVTVWKNKEVSGSFRIRPDGKFSMPLIGDVLAGGNTTDSVSMQIEQKLKLFIASPFVSTIVVESTSNRIFIVGEVANPGTYPITGSLTALQAIAVAGGFTAYANKDKMILVRGTGVFQKNIPLSYSKMLRTPGEKNNPVLERGDTLVIP